jgi:hypothetical protein
MKQLKRYRKLVLTNKPQKQSAINKLFTGKIQYELNQIWSSDVMIEPRDRNSVRLRCPKEYMADARVLKLHQDYTIQNMTTGTKTRIKIS